MPLPDTARVADELPRTLRPAFAPLIKVALGLALAVPMALFLFALALVPALSPEPDPESGTFAWLIANNFLAGYAPTVTGAFVGLAWGLGIGFVMGWFVAASRNLFISVWVTIVGAKERLKANREFLDRM